MVQLSQALKLIYALKSNLPTHVVTLEKALYKVSASKYYANFNMPIFDNSAMDGYAVKLSNTKDVLSVEGEIFAGDNNDYTLKSNQAYKIMTGAKLPHYCEAVIPVEDIEQIEENIVIPQKVNPQANMRFSGEDLKKDSQILNEGDTINAYDIGVLASQGISSVEVYKRLNVSILSSGEELKPHYEPLKNGQLYNSNSPTLEALCKNLHCDVMSSKASQDSYKGFKEAFANCLNSDLIITTGGASVGDKDFTKEVIKDLSASTIFEKIEIKPGKPTSLYKIDNAYVLVLPGNPLAAMVNFEIVGKALIKQLQKATSKYPQSVEAKFSKEFVKKGSRDTVVLGKYENKRFEPLHLQLPGMVKPLQLANAYTILPASCKKVKKDETVDIILLHANIFN